MRKEIIVWAAAVFGAMSFLNAQTAAKAPVADIVHPYTLITTVGKAIEKNENPGGDKIFQAALAAELTGDVVKCRDFLIYLLQKEKGNTPEVRRALVRLCLAGGDPKYFERYLSIAPHDLDALHIGLRQLVSFVYDARARDYEKQLKTLLDTWPHGDSFNQIVRSMHWAIHTANAMDISDARNTLKILAENKKWKLTATMDTFFAQFMQRKDFIPEFLEMWHAQKNQLWRRDILEWLIGRSEVTETEAIELLRRICREHGVKREKMDEYFRRFGRLHKNEEYKKIVSEAKAGKFPETGKIDRLKFNRSVWVWMNTFRAKKFDGKPEEALKSAAEVFTHGTAMDIDDHTSMRQFCEYASRIAAQNPKAAHLYPFEGFAVWAFDYPHWEILTDQYNWVLRAYDAAGRLKEGLERVKKSAASAGTALGFASRRMAYMVYAGRMNMFDTFLRNTSYNAQKREFYRADLAIDRLTWCMDYARRFANAPVPELIKYPDDQGIIWEVYWRVKAGASEAKREMTDAEKRYRTDVDAHLAFSATNVYSKAPQRMVGTYGSQVPVEYYLLSRLEKGAAPAELASIVTSLVCLNRGDWRDIRNATQKLLDLGHVELAYLLVSRYRDIEKYPELQKLRTIAAGRMPGLYPVNEKDPAYPLYVAAEALSRNNPERAWALLSANTKTFDKDPMRYQPQFALWALEQYRTVRGRNDVLRDRAWEHVETLLKKEASLPLEVVAGLFLLRAEIAQDRQQYEVAHAGYQALRNHAQYKTTKAGRQAMFKDVDLMMTMGSLDATAQVAEQWLTSQDVEIRAQGHYILAKIAFLRKDYDETRKELDKVFELDFTHAEARLLQGEWKLATNYEVDDTQVLLGDLADRSAIRPGQPLSVSVQDRNLSVAGGGASIPVLVTTSGGDREKILLYPGTRDPSLFRGSIDTRLGVPKAEDSTLQLSGDDSVSYQIDPDYLTSRGLEPAKPKVLCVVDDAELTIGTGDEARNLRPGLPLHIKLVDRDRSRRAGATSVDVQVVTSSGDRLKAAKLAETGPSTGIFEAKIKTMIPPPRAFASDSAAGKGPQDLISKTRDGVWESLSDGVKPKSVGVDTMSSHLVSSAAIEVANPETIVGLRLYGTLFGDEIPLGSFPTEKSLSRKGVRAVSEPSAARSRSLFLRELSRKVVNPSSLKNWTVSHTAGGHAAWRHLVRATVFIPSDVRIPLRLKALSPDKNPSLTMRFLTVEMYVDGVRVLNLQETDMGGKGKSNYVTFESGLHDIELYVCSARTTDSFELCQELDDGELVSLPLDWTDEKAHPELAERLTDKCKIVRTEKGFLASFVKSERLRTLRWEFTDFAGKAVSARKLIVSDSAGNTIVPSEHDYSQTLDNDILEVAPGDSITVTYEDNITSSGRARIIERKIGSAFANGRIEFLSEDIYTGRYGKTVSVMNRAYRVAPGDTVVVRVTDADLDVTSGSDKVVIRVETASGSKIEVEAKERLTKNKAGEDVVAALDQGVFYAQIRTTKDQSASLPPGMIALKSGEWLMVSYKDDDNTKPGVPVVRSAKLSAVSVNDISLILGNTWTERTEDKSPEGKIRLNNVRRRRTSACATKAWRSLEYGDWANEGEVALVTPEVKMPVKLFAPALVRHGGSTVTLKVSTRREIESAALENREVEWCTATVALTEVKNMPKIKTPSPKISPAQLPDTLRGVVELYSSLSEERAAMADEGGLSNEPKVVPVDAKSGDEIVVRCVDDSGKILAEASAKIATSAWIGLMDSTYEAENTSVHLGEPFYVMVIDPDRDTTDAQDEIQISVSAASGAKRTLTVKETMPRSGIFTSSLTPTIGTNAVEDAQHIQSVYDDTFTFTYKDEVTGVNAKPREISVEGRVFPGSDGDVRAYSKRFRDPDQAVLVQFRIAECLFEMAKDYRRLKDGKKSAEAIADGRRILEAALRDYPNSKHGAEGEFLLANLSEQLAEEARLSRIQRQKDGEDLSNEKDESEALYREAVARFSSILSAWPEGEYAARSQYHKALCLERLGDFSRASEEYVKMTYIFPESPLVGDASVRLASHYYKNEKRYDIAGKIYMSFRQRFPNHPQAPNALFMSGQCFVKQAELLAKEEDSISKMGLIDEAYKSAVECFIALVDNYKDSPNKELLAQGLYWAGDASFRVRDYQNAYIYLKRTTFEYPETKWARYARGMLMQESKSFNKISD